MAVDFWADKYWDGQYFNVQYFGTGEADLNAMSGSASGSASASGTLTFIDNTVIVIDMDGKRRRDVSEKARQRQVYEAARRQSIENAWAKVFGSGAVAKPTPPQKDQLVAIARRDLERRSVPVKATAKDLKILIDAHSKRQRRQKQNRDAMIILLLAA